MLFQVYYYHATRELEQQKIVLKTSSKAEQEGANTLQEQKLTHIHLIDSSEKIKEWEVWSDEAYQKMGSSRWKLDNVESRFYSEENTYSVWGVEGAVDELERWMQVNGDVKLITSSNYTFFTDSLIYQQTSRFMSTEDKVVMRGPKERDGRLSLEGQGFNIDLNQNIMRLENDVQGRKNMSDGRLMKIISDRAKMDTSKKNTIFEDNVNIYVDDIHVSGNYAEFRYLKNQLHSLVMDGGIHFAGQGKTGSSGKAIIYFQEDKYVFLEKPFFTEANNDLIGDKVIVYDGGKRVQVYKGKAEYNKSE